jgi:P pilus assembly chaperone PapD
MALWESGIGKHFRVLITQIPADPSTLFIGHAAKTALKIRVISSRVKLMTFPNKIPPENLDADGKSARDRARSDHSSFVSSERVQ